jgi:hypothetical protein
VSVVVLSPKIVSPGLVCIFGVETIFGRDNIVYRPDGSSYLTRPAAVIGWVWSIAAIGLLVCALGTWLLRSTRRQKHAA